MDDYEIGLSGVHISLTKKTADGRPKAATFTFDTPLDHDALRWVKYQDEAFVPFVLPEVGETVTLWAVEFPY